MIVDLAVERHPDRAVFVGHRLVPAAQIHDAQPTMTEADGAAHDDALIVRAAMLQQPAHALEERGVHRALACAVRDPANAAHASSAPS